MIPGGLACKPHGRFGCEPCAATAFRAVADHAQRLRRDTGRPVADTNGRDPSRMEHERQARLKRWQSPAHPTRKAAT